jgi:perosamine synthetase
MDGRLQRDSQMNISEPRNLAATREFIPIYRPELTGNERAYVLDCLDTSWISSNGQYVDRFEKSFAKFLGRGEAVSVCNGTVALHLALHCLNIGPGDEVIVPTFTYVASVNTIVQTGATPVFAESQKNDWLIDVDDVSSKITSRTRAILPVHLYGAMCAMPALTKLAAKHGLAIVEDASEALGASLDDKKAGIWGDIGTFSFFGNKTVTTGEGGMVVAREKSTIDRLRKVKGQGQSLTRRYWHEELGFNYRMTNICAAIGVAQMERIGVLLLRKRAIAEGYRERLADIPVTFQTLPTNVESSDWLVTVLLPKVANRDLIMDRMRQAAIETRPAFYCAHKLPMYARGQTFPIAEDISSRGISLPSYPTLTSTDLDRVALALSAALRAS